MFNVWREPGLTGHHEIDNRHNKTNRDRIGKDRRQEVTNQEIKVHYLKSNSKSEKELKIENFLNGSPKRFGKFRNSKELSKNSRTEVILNGEVIGVTSEFQNLKGLAIFKGCVNEAKISDC